MGVRVGAEMGVGGCGCGWVRMGVGLGLGLGLGSGVGGSGWVWVWVGSGALRWWGMHGWVSGAAPPTLANLTAAFSGTPRRCLGCSACPRRRPRRLPDTTLGGPEEPP